ncbi:MAG: hypothetical protein JWN41_484 [Thermoleophilia bacterium]|nr:hypothetical protein [Thermoleophilia bacterium]
MPITHMPPFDPTPDMTTSSRFGARPVATIADAVADALDWPRSRPARLLHGEHAQLGAQLVLCTSDGALGGLDGSPEAIALMAVPPQAGYGRGSGRRAYDPFVGASDDVASWQRAQRAVLDAALPIAGGRGGVDERLAAMLGIVPLSGTGELSPIRPVVRDVAKFVGYVPTDALDDATDAVFGAGAGHIGAYDMCSWATIGTGTFRGGEGTKPAVGVPGVLERVEETRFEVVVPTHLVEAVVRAYAAAHPYEEPAYDVLDMRLPAAVGFGRLGRLGTGGGGAVWTALGKIDRDLVVHGRVDDVSSGSTCAVHTGAVRDVLRELLEQRDLRMVVAASASDAEIDVLVSRGIALLLMNRSQAVGTFATEIAGQLTRALTLPVTVAETLHFPREAVPATAPLSGSNEAGTSAPTPDAPDVFAEQTPHPTAQSNADTETGTWRLHFDGGSRGNPGPAAYGWVLYDPDGNEAYVDGVRCGNTTNNVAEWTGLLRGLEHAADVGVRRLAVRGDSELVIKQVTGVYRVKNAALKTIADEVATVVRRFERVDFKHVYRTDNARADELANEAMDGLR